VRFYERKALIAPVGRTTSNYRWYDQRSLERLRFIRLAHAGGFALNDIRSILETSQRAGSASQCRRVGALIEHRLEKVRSQVRELQRLEEILEADLKLCRAGKPHRCAVVDQLQSAAKKSIHAMP
jgi:DNA-binding transcriptional MerR regulator